jgi:hypothetical protein
LAFFLSNFFQEMLFCRLIEMDLFTTSNWFKTTK